MVRARRELEFYSQLHGNELFALLQRRVLVAETVLHFGLQEIGEPVAECSVNAPNIIAPGTITRANVAVELFVPSQRAEELRGDFVFRFDVIRERIGVTDGRNLKARFENFGVCATTDRMNICRWSDEMRLGEQLPRSFRRLPGVAFETPLFPGWPFQWWERRRRSHQLSLRVLGNV